MRNWVIGAVAAVAVATTSCGAEKTRAERARAAGTRVDAPNELARLVPEDVVALVYAPSWDRIAELLRSLMSVAGTKNRDTDEGLKEIVGSTLLSRIDRTKPIAMAISIASTGTAESTRMRAVCIAPLREASKPLAPWSDQDTLSLGSYVAVIVGVKDARHPGLAARTGPAALATAIPAGDVVLRVDVPAAGAALRSALADVDPAKDPLGALGPALREGLRRFAAEGERVDLALWLEGGVLDADVTFVAKPESGYARELAASKDVTQIAALLPRDFAISFAGSGKLDMSSGVFGTMMKASMADMKPDEAARTQRALDQSSREEAATEGTVVFGLDVGPKGLAGVGFAVVKDEAAYRAAVEARTYESGDGLRTKVLPATTVAGVEVWSSRTALDPARADENPAQLNDILGAVLGPDGLLLRETIVNGRIVTVFGDDDVLLEDAIRAAREGSAAPNALARSLTKQRGKPLFALRCDLASVVRSVISLMHADGGPIGAAPLLVRSRRIRLDADARIDGRTLTMRLSLDLGPLAEMIRELVGAR